MVKMMRSFTWVIVVILDETGDYLEFNVRHLTQLSEDLDEIPPSPRLVSQDVHCGQLLVAQ